VSAQRQGPWGPSPRRGRRPTRHPVSEWRVSQCAGSRRSAGSEIRGALVELSVPVSARSTLAYPTPDPYEPAGGVSGPLRGLPKGFLPAPSVRCAPEELRPQHVHAVHEASTRPGAQAEVPTERPWSRAATSREPGAPRADRLGRVHARLAQGGLPANSGPEGRAPGLPPAAGGDSRGAPSWRNQRANLRERGSAHRQHRPRCAIGSNHGTADRFPSGTPRPWWSFVAVPLPPCSSSPNSCLA
jgi:hypothetical protein